MVVLLIMMVAGGLIWNRNHTYTIVDGGQVIVHTTAAEYPATILEEVGISLNSQDRLHTGQTDRGMVLEVRRQRRIEIDYYGQQLEATSWGETVEQLLERLELTVEGNSCVSQPLSLECYDGMKLRIYREFRQQQIYTVTIPCDTVYCADPTLPQGTRRVLTPGRDGEVMRRAEVTYINGWEAARQILSEEMTVHPVDGVVAVGTGLQVPQIRALSAPVVGDGIITLPTGEVLTYSRVISSLATAYCDKGLTATGTQARVGAIAVDPRVIPYGTRMFIMTKDGAYIYGIATAEDCGSKQYIYGTRIDLHYDTEYECRQFGARMCWVYFLS